MQVFVDTLSYFSFQYRSNVMVLCSYTFFSCIPCSANDQAVNAKRFVLNGITSRFTETLSSVSCVSAHVFLFGAHTFISAHLSSQKWPWFTTVFLGANLLPDYFSVSYVVCFVSSDLLFVGGHLIYIQDYFRVINENDTTFKSVSTPAFLAT